MSGRAPRQKGNRVERKIVRRLTTAGGDAKYVPLSGSAVGYPGDACVKLKDRELCLEVEALLRSAPRICAWRVP